MTQLRVGIIGAGRMGEVHAQKVTQTLGCEVSKVWDLDSARTAKLAKGIVFETGEPKCGIHGRKTIRFRGPNGEVLQLVEDRGEAK